MIEDLMELLYFLCCFHINPNTSFRVNVRKWFRVTHKKVTTLGFMGFLAPRS